MAERDQEIQNIKEKMNNVEDDVFASFCEQIGVSNIRQYEERELRYGDRLLGNRYVFLNLAYSIQVYLSSFQIAARESKEENGVRQSV